MTKLKGAAILGALTIAGVTLLTSLPASGGSSFLLVSLKRVSRSCRAVASADSGICKTAAGLLDKLGGLPDEDPTPDAQLDRAVFKMKSFVKRGLRQECCDVPCRSECSGPQDRPCFTDAQCPSGETCIACPEQPCETLCSEFKGNRCDGCVQMVSNLESWLATNGSAKLLSDVMGTACDGRFADPGITQQCKDEIGGVLPRVIDRTLAGAPPLTACQIMGACLVP